MLTPGEYTDVLRAIGWAIDQRLAGQTTERLEIAVSGAAVVVSWQAAGGGLEHERYGPSEIGQLRERAHALRQGHGAQTAGEAAESLRTIGQHLDEHLITLDRLIKLPDGHRLVGTLDSHALGNWYETAVVQEMSAERRKLRGSSTNGAHPFEGAPQAAPDDAFWDSEERAELSAEAEELLESLEREASPQPSPIGRGGSSQPSPIGAEGLVLRMPVESLNEHTRALAESGRHVSVLWQEAGSLAFVARGRPYRSEFHIDPSDELMYVIKGELPLHYRTADGVEEVVVVPEGSMIYTPAGTPHSPRFGPDAFLLVMERPRTEGEIDRFQWFCPSCDSFLHEEQFVVSDYRDDPVSAAYRRFYDSEDFRTCRSCGSVMPRP